MLKEQWVVEHKPEVYWNMLQTAETVAKRYGIARQAQDEYGVRSQLRAAAAAQAGRFNEEIVPLRPRPWPSPTRRRARSEPKRSPWRPMRESGRHDL